MQMIQKEPGARPNLAEVAYRLSEPLVVPVLEPELDAAALELIGSLFEGREVVPVPGSVLAYGGGGPHCITQQVPAA